MTIVFFARFFYPHVGGVEKHMFEVGKRLIKQGHTIIIVSEELPEKDIENEQRRKLQKVFGEDLKKFNIYAIPITHRNWYKKFDIWIWLWKHQELLRKADIIHCHDVFFWYLPFRFLYPTKKVFTTFHGYESYPVKKKAIVYRKIFEKLSFGSICVGDFMRKWYKANPDYVIYGGVETRSTSAKSKKNSAVFIGRLDDQTGIDVYAKAAEELKKKMSGFRLAVYGDGPLRNTLRENRAISLQGFDVSADTKINEYQFAFISRYLAILEALAAKRLVIAVYDNPLKKDYLTMTPYCNSIVVVDNAKTLAEKVDYYARHPLEAEVMVEGGHTIAKKNSWESVVDTYLALWNK